MKTILPVGGRLCW